MTCYDSMCQKLKDTNLYLITGSDQISHELKCYCSELDNIKDELAEMYKEAFIETADDYGLLLREELIGVATREAYDTALRREMIRDRYLIREQDFTYESMKKILRSLNVSGYVMMENYANGKLTIDLTANTYSAERQNEIRAALESLLPCHLELNIRF